MKFFKFSSKFSRNVVKLASGTTIAQLIPVLASPILTRLYSPEEFGKLAIFISIVSVLSVLATGRYELAVMLPKRTLNASRLVILSLTIALLYSLLILFIILVLNFSNLQILDTKYKGLWLYLIPLTVFILGTHNTLSYWLGRQGEYTALAKNKAFQGFSITFSQSIFAFLPSVVSGLILGRVLGSFISALSLLKKFNSFNKQKYNPSTNSYRIIALAKRYKKFPFVNVWSALLNTSSVQLPTIILTFIFSTTVTGFFSLAQRILQMPMTLIGSAIGRVFFESSAKLKDQPEDLKRLTLKLYRTLSVLGFVPIVIILFYGEELFGWVFGEDWSIAGKYAKYLSIWIYFVFTSSPLSHLLTIFEKHFESVVFNGLLFFSRVGILFIAYGLGLTANDTLALYGLVGAVAWVILIFYLLKLAHVPSKEILAHLSLSLLILIPLGWLGINWS